MKIGQLCSPAELVELLKLTLVLVKSFPEGPFTINHFQYFLANLLKLQQGNQINNKYSPTNLSREPTSVNEVLSFSVEISNLSFFSCSTIQSQVYFIWRKGEKALNRQNKFSSHPLWLITYKYRNTYKGIELMSCVVVVFGWMGVAYE